MSVEKDTDAPLTSVEVRATELIVLELQNDGGMSKYELYARLERKHGIPPTAYQRAVRHLYNRPRDKVGLEDQGEIVNLRRRRA